jgi:hypothetical protein
MPGTVGGSLCHRGRLCHVAPHWQATKPLPGLHLTSTLPTWPKGELSEGERVCHVGEATRDQPLGLPQARRDPTCLPAWRVLTWPTCSRTSGPVGTGSRTIHPPTPEGGCPTADGFDDDGRASSAHPMCQTRTPTGVPRNPELPLPGRNPDFPDFAPRALCLHILAHVPLSTRLGVGVHPAHDHPGVLTSPPGPGVPRA